MKFYLVLFSIILAMSSCPVKADTKGTEQKAITGSAEDPYVEAQERLMHAKGSYKTAQQQEKAMESMRKAARLSLRASKLRSKAERLQNKADSLVVKANQQALSRGLYITNPLLPVKMQTPPAVERTAEKPSFVPVPGQSINIIAPKAEEVSYGNREQASDDYLPDPPTVNNF